MSLVEARERNMRDIEDIDIDAPGDDHEIAR